MICPKCGFDQPDDAYCAFCGVNVERYRRQRRKRQYVAYLLLALVGVAGFAVATYIKSARHIEAPELATQYIDKTERAMVEKTALPAAKPQPRESPIAPMAERSIDHPRPSESGRASPKAEGGNEKSPIGDEPSPEASLAVQEVESPDTDQGETYTAAEWFEKGRALDDESESEVEFYRKALEVDPEFAPAYYRLGAIHYRQANYELADQEFAKFLEYASEADRQAYDIYVYYSPSDMERLSAAEAVARESGEEGEKERPVEAIGAEQESVAAAKETEKETSAAVEEGEKEPPVEAEAEAKETPAEAEEIEREEPVEAEAEAKEQPAEAEAIEKEAPEEAEEMEWEIPAETQETLKEIPAEVEGETEAFISEEAGTETE
jgi:tetratricopeptide (TPR) repeat protein